MVIGNGRETLKNASSMSLGDVLSLNPGITLVGLARTIGGAPPVAVQTRVDVVVVSVVVVDISVVNSELVDVKTTDTVDTAVTTTVDVRVTEMLTACSQKGYQLLGTTPWEDITYTGCCSYRVSACSDRVTEKTGAGTGVGTWPRAVAGISRL